jgi:agmatine/peptidylarginine deiminase
VSPPGHPGAIVLLVAILLAACGKSAPEAPDRGARSGGAAGSAPLATRLPLPLGDSQTPSGQLVADLPDPKALLLAWRPEVAQVALTMARAVSDDVAILLLTAPDAADGARATFRAAGIPVRTLDVAVTTPWVRDFGPFVVTQTNRGIPTLSGAAEGLHGDAGAATWFVAPGYHPTRPVEGGVTERLAAVLGVPWRPLSVRLDGGNLVADGAGRCVTTFLTLEANEGLSEAEVVARLERELGCQRVLFVPRLSHEPTGHADMTVAFVAGRAVVAQVDEQRYRDWLPLEATARQLAAALGPQAPPVVRVPLVRDERNRPLSFAQVLRVGRHLLVPDYVGRGTPARVAEAQRAAYAVFAKEFPALTLHPVSLVAHRDLGGGLHCYGIALGHVATGPAQD